MYIYPKNTIDIYAWTLYTPINDLICYELNPFIYIFRFYIAWCAYTWYYNRYSDRRLCIMYTTRRLGKYLKVHPRSGIRTGMSNDDHLSVPVVNIEPDCQYSQEHATSSSNVAGVGLHDLANQANQTEECTSCSPIILYMWKRVFTMEFFGQEILRI